MRCAAILAGGRACRFEGRDKSALVVGGRTILERQLAQLSRVAGLREIFLVGRRHRDGDPVRPARATRGRLRREGHRGPAARVIDDLMPDCGPLGGIHAALTEARGAAVFVVACDMPFIEADLVEHLFDLARDADLVLPRSERGYHPLCAVYTRACLEPIARRLANGRLKVMDLADELRTRVIASDELEKFGARDRLLANVNTPADYATLEALHGHEL
jgi:molybdopterin-guanine dinucleotide biosynthesis protein A